MNSTQDVKKLLMFLVVVFALAGIAYGFMISSEAREPTGPLGILLNWAPAIAAIFTALIMQRNLRGFGWRWGKSRYHFLAWAVPIGVLSLTYLVIWLTGLGAFYDEAHVTKVADDMGQIVESPYAVILLLLVSVLTITFLVNAVLAIGEEIGWRGWLVPLLARRYTFPQVALISGAIWVMFHYPLLLFLG